MTDRSCQNFQTNLSADILIEKVENLGTLNLREWTMQEWTIRHDMARVDIAGVDNAGVVKSAIWVVIIGYFNNRFMDFNRLFVATLMGNLNT